MQLNSSVIKSVDTNFNDLIVTFNSGKTYRYVGAAGHFANICIAPSAGQFFRANIRGKFEFVQI